MFQTALLALMLGQAGEQPKPPQLMRAIRDDLRTVAPHRQKDTRYLWRPATLDDMQWEYYQGVLKGHPNQLSRGGLLVPPHRVNSHLLRLYLRDYKWSREQWEKLSDPYSLDPEAVRVKIVEVKKTFIWDGPEWDKHKGVWPGDGKFYPRRAFEYTQWVKEEVPLAKTRAVAPWFIDTDEDEKIVQEVVYATGTSAPLVHVEWWFNQTAVDSLRPAGYYSWFGLQAEKSSVDDVHAIFGFDRKRIKSLVFELRSAVARSGVTSQPRAFIRWNTPFGGYWESLEFIEAKGEANPLNNFGEDIEKFQDGSEGYVPMPNGLDFTYAANKGRKLVNAVPGTIATDRHSKSNDMQVHVNVSCRRCHSIMGEGERVDISDWGRRLLQPPIKLNVKEKVLDPYDFDALQRLEDKEIALREQYLRGMKGFLATDRLMADLKVKEATGLSSKEYGKRYSEFWEYYEDRVVTAEIVAKDLGITPAELRRKIDVGLKAGLEISPVVGNFVHEGAKFEPIGIRQYEEHHGEFQALIRKVK